MQAWVRYRRGRAWYTGGITRAPFVAWLAMPEGRAALDAAASQTRFAFLARARAARRLWRRLAAAARDPDVIVMIQREMDAYLGRLQEFAYADGLPRAFVWRLPLMNEPPWDGHHYVMELTRDPITRAMRKAVVAAVAGIQASLPSLSRTERNEILRRALRGA